MKKERRRKEKSAFVVKTVKNHKISHDAMPKVKYALTDQRIKDTYKDIIKREKRVPSQAEVAALCDVTRETVNRHLRHIDLHDLVEPFKLFGNEVLSGLLKKAVTGDERAARLFLALVFDWREKHEVEGKIDSDVNFRIEFVDAGGPKEDKKEKDAALDR